MNNNLLSSTPQSNDQDFSLRPSNLSEFIGQDHLKGNLSIFIKAAKERQEALDHVLLYGPPGLGKTTLAQVIAAEMGVNFKSTVGPILSKPADLAAILTNLQLGDIFFIDEIHRLNIAIEEVLYSAMEDFCLDIIIGEGVTARTVKINLNKFTLIGATTRLGLVSKPLRDRFSIPLALNFYSLDDLEKVIRRGADLLSTTINHEGALAIAHRARGTPRIAIRLLRRVRDFALVHQQKIIDRDSAEIALNQLKVDKFGIDSSDFRYLSLIAKGYNGGPVGVETITAALSEKRDVIEEVVEPYLIQIGFISRTSRGRVLTDNALRYLEQTTLF